MTIRERVPKPLRGPTGMLSLGVMVIGIAIGYILTIFGVTLFFDLNGLDDTPAGPVTPEESLVVIVIGVVIFAIGYLGWRGFLYFSY